MAKRLLTTFFCKSKNALPADLDACDGRYFIQYGVSHFDVREAVARVFYTSRHLHKRLRSLPDVQPHITSERQGRLIYHMAQHAHLALELDGYVERRS
mgnify:FL=1